MLMNMSGLSMGGAADFGAKHMRALFDEALDGFKQDVRRDVQNMHVELIRQFELQQRDLADLMAAYSVNDLLVEEVTRLRRENEQLRAMY